MFTKSKKVIALLMAALLLFTACSSNTDENSSSSSEEIGLVGGGEEEDPSVVVDEIKFKHEVINDDSSPMKEDVTLEGEYVTVSEKVSKAIASYNQPHKVFDTEDGNLILFYINNINPVSIDILKIDAKTGKYLEHVTADLLGAYIFVENVTNPSVDGHVILGTSLGVYIFDFDKFDIAPVSHTIGSSISSEIQPYNIDVNEKQFVTMDLERLSVSPVTNQVVYASKDGVYLCDADGKNLVKLTEQVKDDIWIPTKEGSEYKSSVLYGKTAPGYFTKPRFNPDGTKIVLDIINYAVEDPKLALAVIDIATKEVTILKLYGDSVLKETNAKAWNNLSGAWSRAYTFLDNDTMVVTISATIDADISRYDIFYNLKENKVVKSFVNKTGITSDYKLIAQNNSGSEVRFSDLEKKGQIMQDNPVLLTSSNYTAMGISKTKTFVFIKGTGKAEGKFFYIIVNNPAL